jgi:hypothetical protein
VDKYAKAERLALAASCRVSIVFTCDKCQESHSDEETCMHSAALRAIKAGWRIDDLFVVHCPNCVPEELR